MEAGDEEIKKTIWGDQRLNGHGSQKKRNSKNGLFKHSSF